MYGGVRRIFFCWPLGLGVLFAIRKRIRESVSAYAGLSDNAFVEAIGAELAKRAHITAMARKRRLKPYPSVHKSAANGDRKPHFTSAHGVGQTGGGPGTEPFKVRECEPDLTAPSSEHVDLSIAQRMGLRLWTACRSND
jgi:hypothetical protein